MKIVILAGGYATRLESRTNGGEVAKTLLPITVEGKTQPILYFILDKINQIQTVKDISEIIVVTNAKYYKQIKEACKEWKANNLRKNRELVFTILNDGSKNKSEAIGANMDMNLANRYIFPNSTEHVLVMASDNYFDFTLDELIIFAQQMETQNGRSNVIVSKVYPDSDREFIAKNFGILNIDANNQILSLDEKPGIENCKSNNVSLALYLFNRHDFALLDHYLTLKQDNKKERDSLGYFINYLVQNAKSFTFPHHGTFYDIGTPDEYDKLSGMTDNL